MSTPSEARRQSLWPISIIVFFAVAISGCIAFVTFCVMHPTELVASDYYEREVRYQGQLDKLERAQSAPVAAVVSYDAARKAITIQLPPDQVPKFTTGTVHLYRPSAAQMDRHVELKPSSNGEQVIPAGELASGLWQVRVDWEAGGQGYYLDRKLRL